MPNLVDALVQIYTDSPFAYGAADICCMEAQYMIQMAASFYVVMCGIRDSECRAAVRAVVIVLPPVEFSTKANADSIRDAVSVAVQRRLGRRLSPEELDRALGRLRFAQTNDLSVGSVLKVLGSAGAHEAALVLHAGAYREGSRNDQNGSTGAPILPEDLWPRHLQFLASHAIKVAKQAESYMMFATGFPSPAQQKNVDMLKSVEDCGLFHLASEYDGSEMIAAHIDKWVADARGGSVADAFRSIDALPSWMDSQKSLIRLQVVDMVLPGPQSLAMLRSEIASQPDLDPSVRVKLARVAARGGDMELALNLLRPSVDELNGEEELVSALETAKSEGGPLRDAIVRRLARLFPGSRRLLLFQLHSALERRAYEETLLFLGQAAEPERLELETLYRHIASTLGGEGTPDYMWLIAELSQIDSSCGPWAKVLCSREAQHRGDYANALKVLLPENGEVLTESVARLLIKVCLRLLLERRGQGQLGISGDELRVPVLELIRYLAANPTDGVTRVRLVDLLSVETAGNLGLAVIVSLVLDQAQTAPTTSEPKAESVAEEPAEVDVSQFLQRALEWMADQSPLILHLTNMPSELLPADTNALFDNLKQLLHHDQDLRDEVAADAYEKLVFITALVAHHTDHPNGDIDVIRYAAARFIMANRLQKARDFAEQSLMMAGTKPARRRLSWLAFGDIYHRCHNPIEALTAIACMFSIQGVELSIEDLWQEASLLFRVLRDLELLDPAAAVLSILRQTLPITPDPARFEGRLATMELGVKVVQLRFAARPYVTQLCAITSEIESHCIKMMAQGEELSPSLSLLAHCIHLAGLEGYDLPASARATLEKGLTQASAPFRDLMRAVSRHSTDASQFVSLLRSVEVARSHQDAAFDYVHIGTAARRLLDMPLVRMDAETLLVTIEALADHAIRQPTAATGNWFTSIEATIAKSRSVAATGYPILFMGLSESGVLVRVSLAIDGSLESSVEGREVFSGEALLEWSREYPYGYASSNNPNVFWTTTDALKVTVRPSSATILLLDTTLQQMPPNLLRFEDQFFGKLAPVCSVPSLAWLISKQSIQTGRPGKLAAWIPVEAETSNDATLEHLAERLDGPLSAAGIALQRSHDLPDDIEECELVLLAAHGGVLPGEEYFQRISDNETLALYPEALALAVRGSGIVILFICSAGRIDSHPTAETTVGLVKQLLDQGCATVIASPWPLNVSVPPHWTPAFLDEWYGGATAIDAMFRANNQVARALGGELVDCIAMNLYGDPSRRKHVAYQRAAS
ncbi:MAG: CHAT domain-containing protein [Bryobacteraceae bacterium]|nr:CHAT domain-containing protein [Bryobacteraceae bacterium]